MLLLSEINTALEYVEMALKLDPNNGKSWLLHSKILSTNPHKMKEALSSIKKAKALGEFGTIIESEILENNEKFDAAISVLEEYLLNVTENPEVREELSLLLLRNNSLDWSKKVLDEAPQSLGNTLLYML